MQNNSGSDFTAQSVSELGNEKHWIPGVMSDQIVHACVEFLGKLSYCPSLLESVKLTELMLKFFSAKTHTNIISKFFPTRTLIMGISRLQP